MFDFVANIICFSSFLLVNNEYYYCPYEVKQTTIVYVYNHIAIVELFRTFTIINSK
jgi:hypothetical protein